MFRGRLWLACRKMDRSNQEIVKTVMKMKRVVFVAALFGSSLCGLQAQQVAPPAGPQPQAGVGFPAVNPKNFTASTPTVADVDGFLKALWGYDPNRIWQVAAIQKTNAPGVAKIVVLVDDKSQPGRGTQTIFFSTPDGKHAIAGDVIDFGSKPWEENKKLLAARADGPSSGAKSNALQLVEFADLQCPHCKDAADTMDQLATDFPQAKIVFENYPLAELHPYAMLAAQEGVCVRKAKGDDAFFVYTKAVFGTQGALTPDSYKATLASAAMKAGADSGAMAACAETKAAKDDVAASVKLGNDLGIEQTPMLAINGRLLPIGGIPYEVLKKIVVYQAQQDGVAVNVQPTLAPLK